MFDGNEGNKVDDTQFGGRVLVRPTQVHAFVSHRPGRGAPVPLSRVIPGRLSSGADPVADWR